MAESLYRGIQIGKETDYGTAVAATTILPVDEGSGEFQTNRATRFPEEDFGTQVAFLAGRGTHGVRMATASVAADARFEDLGQFLRMMIGAPAYATVAVTSSSVASPSVITTATHGLVSGQSVTIAGHTGSTPDINGTHIVTVINATTFSIPVNVTVGGTGGTVTTGGQTYTAGTTTDTTESMTYEISTDVQDFIASGVKATSLELSYDAIGPGENSPWRVSADLQSNRVVKGSATGSLTIPSVLETMEGHLTQVYQGTTATAFASLGELTNHLIQYSLRIEQEKPLRPYGSTVDYASNVGIRKRRSTMNALFALSATSISDIYDIFDSTGGLLSERRMRIKVNGSANKTMTVDHRLAYMNVVPDPNGRDGEYVLSVEGNATYDSTQATDLVLAITGAAVAALP
jgi:hypothetical protein